MTFDQPYQMAYDGFDVTHLSPVPTNMNAQEITTLRLRPVNQKRSRCQQHLSRFLEMEMQVLSGKTALFPKIELQLQ